MSIPTNYNNDIGQKEINELLDRIEKQLYKEYEVAAAEMQGKLRKYLVQYDTEDEAMRKKLEAGNITEQEFVDWRKRKILNTKRWVEMRNVLAQDAVNADTIALSIIKGHMPSAYAIGHNYGTYMVESGVGIDTSYTLYDRQTVERLIRDNPKLMPDPSPNGKTARKLRENKDLIWNKDHIQSQVVQGILQGEPLKDVAARMKNVTDMDDRAAKRNAATMMTSAQNGGRIDSFKRAENMGIQLKKVWLATLDNHTREAHRDLDGQEQPTDEPFKSELGDIMFPGDPNADPRNVWNCFVGKTNIASNSEIVRSYMHEYQGELITVETAAGIKFTCTPNHPILTTRGWVRAKFLNKSDNLVVTFGKNGKFSRRYPHINHTFPRIDAIHQFGDIAWRERACCLSVNFHGDIPTTDVEIITHKRLLRTHRNVCKFEKQNKLCFKSSNFFDTGKRTFMKHFGSICKTAFGNICGFCELLAFFFRRLRHSEIHSLRPIALFNSSRVKPLNNNVSGTVEIISKCLNGFVGIVFSDNIIDSNRSVSNCHIYNLQTNNNYYFVNTIIAQEKGKCSRLFAISHNCRCTLITQLKGFERNVTDLGLRHDDNLKGMSYDEWKGAHRVDNSEKSAKIDSSNTVLGNTINGYTEEQQKDLLKQIEKADVETQRVFYKYQSQLQEPVNDLKKGELAHFDPNDKRVHFDPQEEANGDNTARPYEVHWHEYGHNIDFLAGTDKTYASLEYRDSSGKTFGEIITNEWDKRFAKTDREIAGLLFDEQTGFAGLGGETFVKQELNSWRKANNISRNSPEYARIRELIENAKNDDVKLKQIYMDNINVLGLEDADKTRFVKYEIDKFCINVSKKYSRYERSVLSDIFERYSVEHGGMDFPFGYGHGAGYAKVKGMLELETFANMFGAEIANVDALNIVKSFLPDTYKAYREILKGM